jgi:hypothetical protein
MDSPVEFRRRLARQSHAELLDQAEQRRLGRSDIHPWRRRRHRATHFHGRFLEWLGPDGALARHLPGGHGRRLGALLQRPGGQVAK